jgi:hypothetical protein
MGLNEWFSGFCKRWFSVQLKLASFEVFLNSGSDLVWGKNPEGADFSLKALKRLHQQVTTVTFFPGPMLKGFVQIKMRKPKTTSRY